MEIFRLLFVNSNYETQTLILFVDICVIAKDKDGTYRKL